jgi:putative nucleotidyltransferase with HDIG domain
MEKINPETLASKIRRLAVLPSSASRVLPLLDDPDSSAHQIALALAHDQSLAANLLKLANSSQYGFARHIGSLHEAVVLLGHKTLRQMVLAVVSQDVLTRPLRGYGLGFGELWEHSMGCAIGTQIIARMAHLPSPEEAFVAGLLHDIGKVVLAQSVLEAFREIVTFVQQKGASYIAAEQEVLGFNHAEVGRAMAAQWGLPPTLREALTYHHKPSAAKDWDTGMLAASIHLSDALVRMLGVGTGIEGLLYPLDTAAIRELQLSDERTEQVKDLISAALREQRDTLPQAA